METLFAPDQKHHHGQHPVRKDCAAHHVWEDGWDVTVTVIKNTPRMMNRMEFHWV